MQKIKNSPVPTFDESDERSPEFANFLSRWYCIINIVYRKTQNKEQVYRNC